MYAPAITDALIVLLRVNEALEHEGTGEQVFTCSSNSPEYAELGRYFMTTKVCKPSPAACAARKLLSSVTWTALARASRGRDFITPTHCPCPTTVTHKHVNLERLARRLRCIQPYEMMQP